MLLTSPRISSYATDNLMPVTVQLVGEPVAIIQPVTGTPIYFSRKDWAEFIRGVKDGEFDVPDRNDGLD